MSKQYNYVIGYKQETGRISCYMIFSSEVFFGSNTDAKETLKTVKDRDPSQKWKIFKIST